MLMIPHKRYLMQHKNTVPREDVAMANTAHTELLRALISSDTYRNKANQKSTRLWCPHFHQSEMMVMHMGDPG